MISKPVSSYRHLLLFLSFLIITAASTFPLSAEKGRTCRCAHFSFSGEYILREGGSEERKIEFPGKLLSSFCSGKSIYYLIGNEEPGEEGESPVEENYRLGYSGPGNEGEERSISMEIKLLIGKREVVKIFAEGENVYIFNGAGILYHINLNSMAVSRREGVIDAALADKTPVLLEKESGNLNINGRILPLTITGEIRIQRVTDNRLVFITNSDETEIVDTESAESIYQYSLQGSYAVPGDHNLVISIREEISGSEMPGACSMVFYKIYIDGIETGRTETGESGSGKYFRTSAAPGRYHVVRLERWELNLKKDRYKRANNLYQPKKIGIYIPLKRIIELEVNYNGTEYNFSKRAVKR